MTRFRKHARTVAPAVLGGLLVALSVPPAGFWPLGVLGLAVLVHLLRDAPRGTRALIGFSAGMGLYGVTIFWFTEFNAIGAVASMAIEAAFLAAAALATPPGRGRAIGFIGAVTASEWLRTYIPFGGVPLRGIPLGGIPLGQAAGPLAPAARLGGQVLVSAIAALAAVTIVQLAAGLSRREKVRWVSVAFTAVGGAVAVLLPVVGRATPSGRDAGTMRVAAVQGGGKRGLRAVHNPPIVAFNAQLAAERQVQPPVDLVLWPEDVIALDRPIVDTTVAARVGALATAAHAALLAGVTEDIGPDRFRNAEVAWDATGAITGRYDKVHRVPFGEYVPLRSLIKHFVNLDVIPRNAIPGTGSGLVRTQAGPVGVVISFEIFFPARARSAIKAGGEVLLAPTNTASYTTTQVPAAEIAALRLRAWETGRDVVMVAPTGWSAVLDARGHLLQRSGIGKATVLAASVHRRTGRTPYVRWGDWPVVSLAIVLIAGAWALALLDQTVKPGKP